MDRIIIDKRVNRPHTIKQLRPYYTDEYKYRVLSRAARICFKGKTLLYTESTLEKWIRRLHAPFAIESYEPQTWGIMYTLKLTRPSDIKVEELKLAVVG